MVDASCIAFFTSVSFFGILELLEEWNEGGVEVALLAVGEGLRARLSVVGVVGGLDLSESGMKSPSRDIMNPEVPAVAYRKVTFI